MKLRCLKSEGGFNFVVGEIYEVRNNYIIDGDNKMAQNVIGVNEICSNEEKIKYINDVISKNYKFEIVEEENEIMVDKKEGILPEGTKVVLKGKTAYDCDLTFDEMKNEKYLSETLEAQEKYGYVEIGGYDYNIRAYVIDGKYYNRCDFDLYVEKTKEERIELQVGDKLILKKDIFCMKKGDEFEVIFIKDDDIGIKNSLGFGGTTWGELQYFTIAKKSLEWSNWTYSYTHDCIYRTKGTTTQVKGKSIGEARLYNGDEYDFNKG
ncbi:MAG: hypothetical protein ACRDDY_00770, partial [Clostridium sp.]|uniref:hypothetical protein n=1 Tax=Clostridium sp. TaxID=1506 RepID=UPI003EE53AA2